MLSFCFLLNFLFHLTLFHLRFLALALNISGTSKILREGKFFNGSLHLLFAVFFSQDLDQLVFEKRAIFLNDESEHIKVDLLRLVVV
jgi:hypothetical protein